MFRAHFNAQIAACDHHAVGQLNDFFQPSDSRRLFNLGQQSRLIANQLLAFGDIFWPLDKGHGDPVHPLLQGKGEIRAVLFGQCRNRDHNVRNIQALAVRQRPANLDLRYYMVWTNLGYPQHQLAIVEQQPCIDFQRCENFGVRQMHTLRIPRRRVRIQPEAVARVQFNLALGKASHTQFGTLQINQYGCWPVIRLFQRADIGNQLRFIGLLAMAHIDAESICACTEQLFDHFRRVARRAQCRQYADLAHAWLVILHEIGSAIWILTFAFPITRHINNAKGA